MNRAGYLLEPSQISVPSGREGRRHNEAFEYRQTRLERITRPNPCGMLELLAEAPGAAPVLSCAAVSPSIRLIVRSTRTGVEDMFEIAFVVRSSRSDLPTYSLFHDWMNILGSSTLVVIRASVFLQSDIQTSRGELPAHFARTARMA